MTETNRTSPGQRPAVDEQTNQGSVTGGLTDHGGGLETVAQLPRGATNAPTPVSADAGNGTDDLRAKLIELLRAANAAHYGGPQSDPAGRPLDYGHLADAVLAAGWCPAPDPDVLIGHFVDFAKTFRPVTEERP